MTMTKEEALKYVRNMWMTQETHDALEALIPEFGKTGSDKEDYKKKYNEAMEVMRQWIAPCHTKEQLDTLKKTVFPELNESEDERVRKHLVEIVEMYWGKTNDPDKAKDLAYLEKQKEPHKRLRDKTPWIVTAKEELAHDEERLQANLEELHRIRAEKEKQKEQKPLKVGENAYFDPNTEMWFIKKEQKPAECERQPEFKEVEYDFRGEKVKVMRPFFRDDKGREFSTTRQDTDLTWSVLREWCENKGITPYDLYPRAEWSEDTIRKAVKEVGLTQHQIDWFKNNVFPPKPECSEEDETRLTNILIMLKEYLIHHYSKDDIDKSVDWLENRVKFLRSSWKPSEKQTNNVIVELTRIELGDIINGLYYLKEKYYEDCKEHNGTAIMGLSDEFKFYFKRFNEVLDLYTRLHELEKEKYGTTTDGYYYE